MVDKGDRRVYEKTILDSFVEDFVNVLDKYCKYIIVSGFVAIAHGRSRGTEDVDMIIEKFDFEKFKKLHEELEKNNFECIQSPRAEVVYEYLIKKDSVRYIRKGTFVPEMEVKFSKDELDEMQLATRKKLEFTGMDVFFSSVEMNIAFKEELLKSDKDMEDAKHLRIIYKDKIDENLINDIKRMIRKLRLNER